MKKYGCNNCTIIVHPSGNQEVLKYCNDCFIKFKNDHIQFIKVEG